MAISHCFSHSFADSFSTDLKRDVVRPNYTQAHYAEAILHYFSLAHTRIIIYMYTHIYVCCVVPNFDQINH